MCGIIGLFIKEQAHQSRLGEWFEPMLLAMAERGPDSAGIAVYRNPTPEGQLKYSLYAPGEHFDWSGLEEQLRASFPPAALHRVGSYGIVTGPANREQMSRWLEEHAPGVKMMGSGREMEIFKDVGTPSHFARRYGVRDMAGSCVIGHTRMATESAVNVEGSHPYTTGSDLCLVHNGSYANHNSVRRVVARHGITFDSLNDTEVAAGYVQWRLRDGEALAEVLGHMLEDFSGFFTLAIGLRGQFAVMRDRFACKPMVVAETDAYVACGSEFRALAHLPGVNEANIFEPEPEGIFVWSQ